MKIRRYVVLSLCAVILSGTAQAALFTEEFTRETDLLRTNYQADFFLPLKYARNLAGVGEGV